MTRPALVDTISATAVTVAENLYGDVNQTVQMAAARPIDDFIRDFDLNVGYRFVGRDAVFAELDSFVANNPALFRDSC